MYDFNDPKWNGWTRDLSVVPDITKDGYCWEEREDEFGIYYTPVKDERDTFQKQLNKASSNKDIDPRTET